MKLSLWSRTALLCAALLDLPDAAGAATPNRPPLADGPSLEAGQPALAPFAHVVFCKRYPQDCASGERPNEVVILDPEVLAAVRRVNVAVNRAIRPKPDAPGPLGDIWNIAPGSGDCDDFAVTKRHRLIVLGFPPSALRLAIARTRRGEGHAVTIVRTDKGDLVLDNRFDRPVKWDEAGLTLVKLQSGVDPRRWQSETARVALSE